MASCKAFNVLDVSRTSDRPRPRFGVPPAREMAAWLGRLHGRPGIPFRQRTARHSSGHRWTALIATREPYAGRRSASHPSAPRQAACSGRSLWSMPSLRAGAHLRHPRGASAQSALSSGLCLQEARPNPSGITARRYQNFRRALELLEAVDPRRSFSADRDLLADLAEEMLLTRADQPVGKRARRVTDCLVRLVETG